MERYRVTGHVARFGPGQQLELSPEQIAPRAHRLEILDPASGRVAATSAVEFKCGEVIGMPDLPRYLAGIVEPADPPSSGEPAFEMEPPRPAKRNRGE